MGIPLLQSEGSWPSFSLASFRHFAADKPPSAVAHYIAGVLDQNEMAGMVDALAESASLRPGDRVATLKGSLRGEIVAILDDGQVRWRADTGTEFLTLPEGLRLEDRASKGDSEPR